MDAGSIPMNKGYKPTTPMNPGTMTGGMMGGGAAPMVAQPMQPAQPIGAPQTTQANSFWQGMAPQVTSSATQNLMSLLLNKNNKGTTSSSSTPNIMQGEGDTAPLIQA